MTKKHAYISNKMQLQNHSLTSIHKYKSLPSATSFLSRSPMAHNTTASLDKLNCTDYVDFRKCQDRFGQIPWSKNDFNYLDVKLKLFKKDDNQEFRPVQNRTMGKRILTSLCDWGISWSMQQKSLLERKIWCQCWYLHCTMTWMNNSNWLTR